MIEVQHVSKKFGANTAVSDVSFSVKEGDTLVILGTSGSGKTTLLRMINRLVEPSAGNILVNGENIGLQPAEDLRKTIGYVIQGYGLFPHYTAAENIGIVPNLLNWPKEKIKHRVIALMNKLRLPYDTYGNAYPNELSGGQQQRVGLARALAANPPILLMDEPFGALDPITRAEVRQEFLMLDELHKKTIIMVTHDVPEAFEMGDQVALMDKGKLQQAGTPADLLFRPSGDFVQEFLSHQRMQLELQAITLADIWEQLPDAADGQQLVFSSQQSLWEVAEMLSVKRKPMGIQHLLTGEQKSVDLSTLFSAFTQLNPVA